MKPLFSHKPAVACAAIVAAFFGTAGLTSAQNLNDAAQNVEETTPVAADYEIIVEAPIQRRLEQSSASPTTKVEIIQLSRRVSFADLDLAKTEDVETLKLRIKESAKDSCAKLSEMYPLIGRGVKDRQRCLKEAVKRTEEQLNAAIEAAK